METTGKGKSIDERICAPTAGMGAHLLELALREPRRLVENIRRDGNLPDVVEHRSVAEPFVGLLVHVQGPREAERQDLGPLNMGVGVMLEVGVELHRVDAERERLERLPVDFGQLLVLFLVEAVRVIGDHPEREREREGARPHQLVEQVHDRGSAGRRHEVNRDERKILAPELPESRLTPERLGDVDPEGVDEKVGQSQQQHRENDLRSGDRIARLYREEDRAVRDGVEPAERKVEERAQTAPDETNSEVFLGLSLDREPVAHQVEKTVSHDPRREAEDHHDTDDETVGDRDPVRGAWNADHPASAERGDEEDPEKTDELIG